MELAELGLMQAEELWSRELPLFNLMKTPDLLSATLDKLSEVSPAEKRQKLHWRAKVNMLQLNYGKAVSLLTSGETQFGPHLGISADLATCYYLMGLPNFFHRTVKNIANEILPLLPQLHIINQIRTITIVGKLLEEAAQFEKAFKLYQQGLNLLEAEITQPTWSITFQPLYIRLLAQILRFYAQYDFLQKMFETMNILERFQKGELPLFYSDEIAHALLLATLRTSKDFTYEDLEKYIQTQTAPVNEFMQNLFFYEFIEFQIRTRKQISNFQAQFERYPPANTYDGALKDIVLNRVSNVSQRLDQAKESLSLASTLRLFMLVQKNENFRLSKLQSSFLTSSLMGISPEDQSIIYRWVSSFEDSVPELIVHNSGVRIENGGITQKWKLDRKPIILKMLLLFTENQSRHWLETAELLWESSESSQNYDRLRMLILRTNKFFSQHKKLFEIRNEHVVCHVKIRNETS